MGKVREGWLGPHTHLLHRDDAANFSNFFHGGGDGGVWLVDEDESEASVGASHPTPSQSRCNRGFKSIFGGGGGERLKWTARRTDLEL